jgi:hypothetical protein
VLECLTGAWRTTSSTTSGVVVRTVLSALLAAALAALSPAARPAATPAPSVAPSRCTAAVTPVLRWSGGFQAQVRITNTGDTPMYAWYVSWQWPLAVRLAEVWNGIAMVSGPVAMVHAPSWRSPLAPGATAIAGVLATGELPVQADALVCG